MAHPHPALIELAAGRPMPLVDDIDTLLRSAFEHRMHGLLWSAHQRGDLELDSEHERVLAARTLWVEAHHQRLWDALQRTNTLLTDRGIDAATFKGVTAEARWYNRMGERPVRDIDILIAPNHRNRLQEIIRTLQPDHPLAKSAQELVDRGHLQSIDLIGPSRVAIDLHVDMLKYDLPTLQAETIWTSMLPFPLPDGSTVRVPNAEISLILFLLHLNKDRFSYLLAFVDVARILEQEQLDWEFVADFCQREGLEGIVYSSLQVVTDTLDIPYPVSEIPRPGPRSWWQHLWKPEVRLLGDKGITQQHRLQFWMPFMIPGRKSEAFRRWFQRVFPPTELVEYYFPEMTGPYPLRLLRGRLREERERRTKAASLP